MKKKRVVVSGLIGLAVGLGVFSTTLAQTTEARGKDIHFRGPLLQIARDGLGKPTGLTVKVNEAQVQLIVTPWTEAIQARGFGLDLSNLRLGDFVEVAGYFTSSGKILARQIHLESSDAVDAAGLVQSRSGNTLHLNGIDFLIDSNSVIRRTGRTSGSVSEISSGTTVRLRASYVGGLLQVLELEYGPRTVESDPLRFEGISRQLRNGLLSVDVGVQSVDALVALDSSTEVAGTLAPGTLVEVEGRFLPGTALVKASRVSGDENDNGNVYDDDNQSSEPADEEVELQGVIRSLALGSGGAVTQIRVEQTLVFLDSRTEIHFADEVAAPSSALMVGVSVRVEGTLRADESVAASEIQIESESPALQEAELEGTIQSLESVAQAVVSFRLNGLLIRLDSSTRVYRGDAMVPSSELRAGQEVHVRGTGQLDGSILASRIEISEDEGEKTEEAEVEGGVSGVKRNQDGSVSQFTVSGVVVIIDAATVIRKGDETVDSSQLETGQKAHVKGLRQPDDSVLARDIKIEDGE